MLVDAFAACVAILQWAGQSQCERIFESLRPLNSTPLPSLPGWTLKGYAWRWLCCVRLLYLEGLTCHYDTPVCEQTDQAMTCPRRAGRSSRLHPRCLQPQRSVCLYIAAELA